MKSMESRSVQWQSDMLSHEVVRLFSSPGLPPLWCVLFWSATVMHSGLARRATKQIEKASLSYSSVETARSCSSSPGRNIMQLEVNCNAIRGELQRKER